MRRREKYTKHIAPAPRPRDIDREYFSDGDEYMDYTDVYKYRSSLPRAPKHFDAQNDPFHPRHFQPKMAPHFRANSRYGEDRDFFTPDSPKANRRKFNGRGNLPPIPDNYPDSDNEFDDLGFSSMERNGRERLETINPVYGHPELNFPSLESRAYRKYAGIGGRSRYYVDDSLDRDRGYFSDSEEYYTRQELERERKRMNHARPRHRHRQDNIQERLQQGRDHLHNHRLLEFEKRYLDNEAKRNLHVWSRWRTAVNDNMIEDFMFHGDAPGVVPLHQVIEDPTPYDDPYDSHPHRPNTLFKYSAAPNKVTDLPRQTFLEFGIPRARMTYEAIKAKKIMSERAVSRDGGFERRRNRGHRDHEFPARPFSEPSPSRYRKKRLPRMS